jgi:hypothetical protein
MKTNYEFELDGLYQIEFLDHAMGNGILPCWVVGWVVHDKADEVILTTWYALGSKETIEENREYVSIVKCAIKRVKKFSGLRKSA